MRLARPGASVRLALYVGLLPAPGGPAQSVSPVGMRGFRRDRACGRHGAQRYHRWESFAQQATELPRGLAWRMSCIRGVEGGDRVQRRTRSRRLIRARTRVSRGACTMRAQQKLVISRGSDRGAREGRRTTATGRRDGYQARHSVARHPAFTTWQPKSVSLAARRRPAGSTLSCIQRAIPHVSVQSKSAAGHRSHGVNL